MTLLTKTEQSLPAHWYYDADQYAAELSAIWYQDWICVGRLADIATAGDFRVARVGDQRVILTRNQQGNVRAFHNTCRHRGSLLCSKNKGRFPNGRIICPYHSWSYSLDGHLLQTPARVETEDFRSQDYSLYEIHVDVWGGYLFINLASSPRQNLAEFLGSAVSDLQNWPLGEMVVVHQEITSLACNWKIFWENYSECYHCPRIHPELCRVVPVYKKGLLSYADEAGWRADHAGDDGRPRVAHGLDSWTMDGKSDLPRFEHLTDEEIAIGMTFASLTASMYVVAHPDYVRSVRLLPTGPESVDLVVEWLLSAEVFAAHRQHMDSILQLGRLVVEQDGRVCELNQQGLRSMAHNAGVLVPQEHSVWEFHNWLRERLSDR